MQAISLTLHIKWIRVCLYNAFAYFFGDSFNSDSC